METAQDGWACWLKSGSEICACMGKHPELRHGAGVDCVEI